VIGSRSSGAQHASADDKAGRFPAAAEMVT
jgi:hypothetical protein